MSRNFSQRVSDSGPGRPATLLSMALVACALMLPQPTSAQEFCSSTAIVSFKACRNEVADDYWIEVGNCLNEPTIEEVLACWDEVIAGLEEAREECAAQRAARFDLCDALGEDPYDPDFDPADFTTEFNNQNPYWPLKVGNKWVFEGDGEVITVEVLDETKLIEGVTSIVVNDLVTVDGLELEDTDDWFAQANNGDVWYTGEISLNYEVFPGDDPPVAELVDVEGSWKTGREGAKPGIVMFGAPEVGTVYRQEVALGDAEDAAEIISINYGYGNDPELDNLVPEALADLLCDDDCVVTKEFTPVEPEVEELKYYSPLVGVFLEVGDGEIVQLVECNVHPTCEDLPEPGPAPGDDDDDDDDDDD